MIPLKRTHPIEVRVYKVPHELAISRSDSIRLIEAIATGKELDSTAHQGLLTETHAIGPTASRIGFARGSGTVFFDRSNPLRGDTYPIIFPKPGIYIIEVTSEIKHTKTETHRFAILVAEGTVTRDKNRKIIWTSTEQSRPLNGSVYAVNLANRPKSQFTRLATIDQFNHHPSPPIPCDFLLLKAVKGNLKILPARDFSWETRNPTVWITAPSTRPSLSYLVGIKLRTDGINTSANQSEEVKINGLTHVAPFHSGVSIITLPQSPGHYLARFIEDSWLFKPIQSRSEAPVDSTNQSGQTIAPEIIGHAVPGQTIIIKIDPSRQQLSEVGTAIVVVSPLNQSTERSRPISRYFTASPESNHGLTRNWQLPILSIGTHRWNGSTPVSVPIKIPSEPRYLQIVTIFIESSGNVRESTQVLPIKKDLEIAAQLPTITHPGDVIKSQIELKNRTQAPIDGRLEISGAAQTITIPSKLPPNSSVEVPIEWKSINSPVEHRIKLKIKFIRDHHVPVVQYASIVNRPLSLPRPPRPITIYELLPNTSNIAVIAAASQTPGQCWITSHRDVISLLYLQSIPNRTPMDIDWTAAKSIAAHRLKQAIATTVWKDPANSILDNYTNQFIAIKKSVISDQYLAINPALYAVASYYTSPNHSVDPGIIWNIINGLDRQPETSKGFFVGSLEFLFGPTSPEFFKQVTTLDRTIEGSQAFDIGYQAARHPSARGREITQMPLSFQATDPLDILLTYETISRTFNTDPLGLKVIMNGQIDRKKRIKLMDYIGDITSKNVEIIPTKRALLIHHTPPERVKKITNCAMWTIDPINQRARLTLRLPNLDRDSQIKSILAIPTITGFKLISAQCNGRQVRVTTIDDWNYLPEINSSEVDIEYAVLAGGHRDSRFGFVQTETGNTYIKIPGVDM